MNNRLSVILFLIGILSCQKKVEPISGSILFLGHTYLTDTRVDPRIEKLQLEKYEHFWLGGDICAASDRTYSTLTYIDSLFHISQPGNYWALGNHDVSDNNYHWISEVTGRKDYYSESHNGLTVIVLNTNLKAPECDRLEEQYQMFKSVCDTIKASSHLIVLTHHIIWNHVKGTPNLWHRANANYPYWESRCTEGSKFHRLLYPMLTAVRKRGIEILVISGDYGQKEKSFQQQTNEGVWFIGSGIDHSNRYFPDSLKESAKDQILFLQHEPNQRKLSWEFLNLDSLVQ